MSEQVLYVVEVQDMDDHKKWMSTSGVSFTREAGRRLLKGWQGDTDILTYRLKKYVPSEGRV